MTEQEKWRMTIQYMQQVRANYHLLRDDGAGRNVRRLRRLAALARWKEVIARAYARLRDRRGKSSARARHDWLVARAIELTVFDQAEGEAVRRNLNSRWPHTQRYVEDLEEAAVRAVLREAEEAGLFDGNQERIHR